MNISNDLFQKTVEKLEKLASKNLPVVVEGVNYYGLPFSVKAVFVQDDEVSYFDEEGILCSFNAQNWESDLYFSLKVEKDQLIALSIKDEEGKVLFTHPKKNKIIEIVNSNYARREFLNKTQTNFVVPNQDRATVSQVKQLEENIGKYVNANIGGEEFKPQVVDVWVNKLNSETLVVLKYKNTVLEVDFERGDTVAEINNEKFLYEQRLQRLN